VAARPVGCEPAGDAYDGGRALLEAVHVPELKRREPKRVHEVQRQDRRDDLRRDVREQADEAEQNDVARDLRPDPSPAQPQ
jgi:hypothetical protein